MTSTSYCDGRATWKTTGLRSGSHRVAASYIADRGSAFLSSVSLGESHTVGGRTGDVKLDSDVRPDKSVVPVREIAPARPDSIKRPDR